MITDDFIGVYDNAFSQDDCLDFIAYFEKLKSMNLVFDRQKLQDGKAHQKKDETLFLMEPEIMMRSDNPVTQRFIQKFWPCYEDYAHKYSILLDADPHSINSIRLQKTQPAGGYHVWHFESGTYNTSSRIIAFMMYLNTIDSGGETEFLYYHKRIEAKMGRLLIWPSGFTHTHRGNPPLSKDKYIITGWLEYNGR